MSATAVSRSGEASTPTAMQATTKVATCPRITTSGRGEHLGDGAAPSRTPIASVASSRRIASTRTRADCRRDDQSDAGDGDREEHDAHSGSVGRHPERHQHHRREDELHRLTGRALRDDGARRLGDAAHAAPVRDRPIARRRSRRPAAPSSGTASGSRPPPTRPSRASARGGRRGSATATRRRRWRPRRARARRPPGRSRPRRARGGTAPPPPRGRSPRGCRRPPPRAERPERADAERAARRPGCARP